MLRQLRVQHFGVMYHAMSRVGIALAALLTVAASTNAAKPPNILVFLSDDHSAPHLGCYNNPDIHTPNLDAFAAQGIRFDRAYASSPQCVPARASIMTGRSPVRIGMTRFSAPLPLEVATYPELLRRAGYFTGVAGRTFHLDGAPHPDESVKVFAEHDLQTFTRRMDYVKTTEGLGGNKTMNEVILSQFSQFLDLVPKDKPFFLQLCTHDPHRPFDGVGIPSRCDPAKLKLPVWFPGHAGGAQGFRGLLR